MNVTPFFIGAATILVAIAPFRPKKPPKTKDPWQEKGATPEEARLLGILTSIGSVPESSIQNPLSLQNLIAQIHSISNGRTALLLEALEILYAQTTPSIKLFCLEVLGDDDIYGEAISRAIIRQNRRAYEEIYFLERQEQKSSDARLFINEVVGRECDTVVEQLRLGNFVESDAEKFLRSMEPGHFATGRQHLHSVYKEVFPFDFVPGDIRAFLRFSDILICIIGKENAFECMANAINRIPLSIRIIGCCEGADVSLMEQIRDTVTLLFPYLSDEVLGFIQETETKINPQALKQLYVTSGAEKLRRKVARQARN